MSDRRYLVIGERTGARIERQVTGEHALALVTAEMEIDGWGVEWMVIPDGERIPAPAEMVGPIEGER